MVEQVPQIHDPTAMTVPDFLADCRQHLDQAQTELREIEIGETDVHHWKGADEEEMQGLLIKPVGYEVGKRYPLVMSVHGGPSGVSGSRYYAANGWAQLMANEGYAVFGKVTDGMDVVDKIKGVATATNKGHSDVPIDTITIESIRTV